MKDEQRTVPVETKRDASGSRMLSPFESLREEIDHVFDASRFGEWRSPFGMRPLGSAMPTPPVSTWRLSAAVDIAERGDVYEVTVELPGVKRDDIEVSVSNGLLTIAAEKKEIEERSKDRYLSERRYGSFARSFGLPEGIAVSEIEAMHDDGVLKALLPKTPEAKQEKKTIAVPSASG